MPLEADLERVLLQIKKAIREKKKIIIVGWKASNHNPITRKLKKEGVFRFLKNIENKINKTTTGLVIFTRFAGHYDIEQIRKEIENEKIIPLTTIGKIKILAQECANEFFPELLQPKPKELTIKKEQLENPTIATTPATTATATAKEKEAEPVPTPTSAPIPPIPTESTTESATLPAPKKTRRRTNLLTIQSQEQLAKFGDEFMQATNHNPETHLSKFKTGEIIRRCFPDKKQYQFIKLLVKQGWLMPVIASKRKAVGSYSAANRLLELATAPTPELIIPTAAQETQILSNDQIMIERIKQTISQKGMIERKINELKALLVQQEEQLAKIQRLEEAINELIK